MLKTRNARSAASMRARPLLALLTLLLAAPVVAAQDGEEAVDADTAFAIRMFSYYASIVSFVAFFLVYRGFLKRMRAPAAAAPKGFCPACGTPHPGDAACARCGRALAPLEVVA